METMFAAGRRSLPPVPRPLTRRAAPAAARSRQEPTRGHSDETAPVRRPVPASTETAQGDPADVAQAFVARLRGAAAEFAAAAGARTAVVREAVPPARHRRSRCRVVLRYPDGGDVDLTFLGPAGRPGAGTQHRFDESIQRWLGTGQRREPAWLVPDEDAADGTAVDVTAWLAAG
jgi:hypothetical protein